MLNAIMTNIRGKRQFFSFYAGAAYCFAAILNFDF